MKLIYTLCEQTILTKQLTNHINKQFLKPMGRWDKTAPKTTPKPTK